jgi:hypothetical protein
MFREFDIMEEEAWTDLERIDVDETINKLIMNAETILSLFNTFTSFGFVSNPLIGHFIKEAGNIS